MFQNAIQSLRDTDPERLAIYERKLTELTSAYTQVGWRRVRRGPCGIEVQVSIGKHQIDLPVTADEALALVSGRAHVLTRAVGTSRGACRIEIKPCSTQTADVHERAKRAKKEREIDAEAEERARKLCAIETRLGKLDELTIRLRAERDELIAQDTECAA